MARPNVAAARLFDLLRRAGESDRSLWSRPFGRFADHFCLPPRQDDPALAERVRQMRAAGVGFVKIGRSLARHRHRRGAADGSLIDWWR